MRIFSLLFTLLIISSCSKDNDNSETGINSPYQYSEYDGSLSADFGELPYRVYYPEGFTGQTNVIFVQRGGTGMGDERGLLFSYVEALVQHGYVVVQINHRNAGLNTNNIAKFRGEELLLISQKIANGELNYGDFTGSVDGNNQGYIGHSAGCMGGLMVAGTEMNHGDYYSQYIKAVYGMSPAGNMPDQYGITNQGFSKINNTSIFLIFGEEEKDINGVGRFMANDWRFQAYAAMNTNGPRFLAYAKGDNTTHADINDLNAGIMQYNIDNSKAFFDTYIRGENVVSNIGNLSIPENNIIELQSKGL